VKRLFGNLFVIALIAAVVSFFAAPAVAFFAIRGAADANDAAGLERLIDYGAVRQSLRPQLSGNPAARAPAPSFLEDPIGAVRRQLEPAVAGAPDPDVYLTPAALAALSRGEGRYASQRTGPAAAGIEASDPMPKPVFWGVNRARMAVTDDGGSRTVFTFERKGPFEWKLVHIGLPDGVSPSGTRSAVPPGRSVGSSGVKGG
tara:strand:+ start:1159 stop:1764 length:606 start_codon:yes stop_codon:yes gene_type:complete